MPTKQSTPAKKSVTPKSVVKTIKPVVKKAEAAEVIPMLDLTKKYRSHKGDNGSTDIQIIGVTDKITSLMSHLATHAKDHDSRRGLLMMVGKRRRLLNYLKRQDEPTYGKLVADLGLRK